MTGPVSRETVREFIFNIAAQAKAALNGMEKPGYLQMSRLHPTSEKLVPSRYRLSDVERMIADAVAAASDGHNVYIEGRTIREDTACGNRRGKLEDTAAVFALVIDSDADKQMGWDPDATASPSMSVETSPGNFQYWFFLRDAVSADIGQQLGERIRKAVNCDHDTGNVGQPYRVAGTANYPNKKKRERGRITVATRLVDFNPEVLWTPELLEQAFPVPNKANGANNAAATDPPPDESNIPADTLKIIRDGVAEGLRSDAFWNVVRTLKLHGFTLDGIVALLEKYPDGIARKYIGRLRHEVERVYNKLDQGHGAQARQTEPQTGGGDAGGAPRIRPGPFVSMEALQPMTFEPIKYVVPGVIVEGLTLLAGKPKIGKSWLLLHAGIAVASGGFTLGDIHCIEGDVLDLALEDNLRRVQARATKLLGIARKWPKRMVVCCEWPRLAEGGLDEIKHWIEQAEHPRLVIIDTLAMVKTPKTKVQTQYEADYGSVTELRRLANQHNVAIVLVHHLRKADADDALDTVSATLGLTGAVDTVIVLKRDTTGTIVMHGRGRDLIDVEKAMTFDKESCLWRIAGDASAVRLTTERAAIIQAVEEAGEPVGPRDIADAIGMRAQNVRFLLSKLVKDGAIEKAAYGKYRATAKSTMSLQA
jgi:hypothetical protein